MPTDALPAGAEPIPVGIVRGAYGVRGWLRVAAYATDGEALGKTRRWWLMNSVEEARSRPNELSTTADPPGPIGPNGLAARPARALTVTAVRHRNGEWLAQCLEIDSKEAADALKGAEVAVLRSDFPQLAEGQHYLRDLLGKHVVNRQGIELGTVVGLRESGPAQWLEVSGASDVVLLIPLVDQYIDAIDPHAGLIRVDWQDDW